MFPVLEKLGITVDENKIKDAWIKGAENVKAATYSIYGDQISKLYASKAKLADTRKKTSVKKTPGVGSINPARPMNSEKKFKGYNDISRKIIGY